LLKFSRSGEIRFFIGNLIEVLRDQNTPRDGRIAVAWVLGLAGSPLAREQLNNTKLHDPDERVREEAEIALRKLPLPLQITTSTLSPATLGVAYTATLEVVGGTPPYRWSLKGTKLPIGLQLDKQTGIISGVPITHSPKAFQAGVTDSLRDTTIQRLTLTVN
jgi:hypothetical protein